MLTCIWSHIIFRNKETSEKSTTNKTLVNLNHYLMTSLRDTDFSQILYYCCYIIFSFFKNVFPHLADNLYSQVYNTRSLIKSNLCIKMNGAYLYPNSFHLNPSFLVKKWTKIISSHLTKMTVYLLNSKSIIILCLLPDYMFSLISL